MHRYEILFYIKPMGSKRVEYSYVLQSAEELDINSADNVIENLMHTELLTAYPYNENWQVLRCKKSVLEVGLNLIRLERKKVKKQQKNNSDKVIEKSKLSTSQMEAYNFKESALIDRNGKIYYCAFSQHLELIRDLHETGIIDTNRLMSDSEEDEVYKYDSLLSWPEKNGWLKISMVTFHFGNTGRKGIADYHLYDWKLTLEQLKTITYLLACQNINHIRVNYGELISTCEFLKIVQDNSYNVINEPHLNLGREYIGNKASNLSILNNYHLNIPKFIVIPNDTCLRILKEECITDALIATLKLPIAASYSVRSSAPISMPGMLDTVLDVKEIDLKKAIWQVINSWHNQRAIDYRKLLNISDVNKISVIIQTYVDVTQKNSGSGVCVITSKNFYGEYLPEMVGEKLVSGLETPNNISALPTNILMDLKEKATRIFQICYKIPQEIEFCFLDQEVYILQSRDYKITKEKDVTSQGEVISIGRKGHIGVTAGRIVFDAQDIKAVKGPKIYTACYTSPEEILNMSKCVGVMTAVGGGLSHAAIAAKNLNIVCVTGAGFKILEKFVIFDKGLKLTTGDFVIIDGNTGEIKIKKDE